MPKQEPEDPKSPNARRAALVGVVIVLLLVLIGLLLVHVLRNMSQIQDCVMSGRSNCVPIDSSAPGK